MTELPEDTLDRLMTGSCEASCPNSDYGHSNPDPNTTTTTTQIQTVQGTIRVQASGDFSSVSAAKKTELFGMLVAHAAGAGVSADMVSLVMSTSNTLTTVEFTVTVSNVDSATTDSVRTALTSMTASKMNDVMGMIFGECAGYTLTTQSGVCMGDASGCDSELMSSAGSKALALTLLSMLAMFV